MKTQKGFKIKRKQYKADHLFKETEIDINEIH